MGVENYRHQEMTITPRDLLSCTVLLRACGLFCLLVGCSSNQQFEYGRKQHLEAKSQLKIDNGINRGTGYTDSLGTKYNLRYIPITIINESAIPIHLKIAFSKEYDYPIVISEDQFNVIPLPEEWALDGMEITDSMIDELKNYVDKPSVNKNLEPGEEFVLALGTRYRPTGCAALPSVLFVQSDSANFQACDSLIDRDGSTDRQLALGLKLDFYQGRSKESCIIIPCGQISYPTY